MNKVTKSEAMDAIKRVKQVGTVEKIVGMVFLAISVKLLSDGSEMKGGAVVLEDTLGKWLDELKND